MQIRSIAFALALATTLAHADELVTDEMASPVSGRMRPMIEIGGGVETAGQGLDILLRVRAAVVKDGNPVDTNDLLGPEQYVIAHVQGDFAIAVDPNAPNRLPYMDIQFTPFADRLSISNASGNSTTGTLALLPLGFHRDTRANRNLAISVSILGAEFGGKRVASEKLELFAKIAAQVLGYKAVLMDQDMGNFHGFRLFGIEGAVGLNVIFKEGFGMRVTAGVKADFNPLGSHGGAFSLQTDHGAYLGLAFDLTRFVQIFARASITGYWDLVSGYEYVPQLMTGVSVIFP